jgi:hypothetical protein
MVEQTAPVTPPVVKIAAALRTTTEFLARELVEPSNEAPDWTDFEWRIARAVAAMQGVSSLLSDGLRWKGPKSWQTFLEEQLDQTAGRHRLIRQLLNAIDSQSRTEAVALIALKGAALLSAKIYQGNERPMGDIDLLIRAEDASAVARVLERCGYVSAFLTHREHVFRPRTSKPPVDGRLGEHIDNPINVEVHTRIAERLPVQTVDISESLQAGLAHAGINLYPSNAALMMHLLLHAAGNIRARALRLIQLHDIARLAARFTPYDWNELLAAKPRGGTLWWAMFPLRLAARYCPISIPSYVFAALRAGCPRLLPWRAERQTLTDVSWSNIRIEAFPGVEWSRTPWEAIAFMTSRVLPSREARLELQEGAAQIPGSAKVPWYGLPHSARILRWVFSRPPRVQTMLSVRAALASEA